MSMVGVSAPPSSIGTGRLRMALSRSLKSASAGQFAGASVKLRVPCVDTGQETRNRAKNPVPRGKPFVLAKNALMVASCTCSAIVSRAPRTVKLSEDLRSTGKVAPSHNWLYTARLRISDSEAMPCPPNTLPASLLITPPDGQFFANANVNASGVASP